VYALHLCPSGIVWGAGPARPQPAGGRGVAAAGRTLLSRLCSAALAWSLRSSSYASFSSLHTPPPTHHQQARPPPAPPLRAARDRDTHYAPVHASCHITAWVGGGCVPPLHELPELGGVDEGALHVHQRDHHGLSLPAVAVQRGRGQLHHVAPQRGVAAQPGGHGSSRRHHLQQRAVHLRHTHRQPQSGSGQPSSSGQEEGGTQWQRQGAAKAATSGQHTLAPRPG
jgi:hypothetical protein